MITPLIRFCTGNRFRKQMFYVVILKLLFIFILWGLFFSHPVSQELNLNKIATHYLEPTVAEQKL